MTLDRECEPMQANQLERREFLKQSSIGAALALSGGITNSASASRAHHARAVIQLNLVGGPSQLDTWDPKPNAPSSIRGPFQPIATSVPGIPIAETFPRMARWTHRYSLVRTLHHTEAPIHETGLQLMQTGTFATDGSRVPHFAAVANQALGMHPALPSWVVLPTPMGDTGVDIPQGQSVGDLGPSLDPFLLFGGADDLAYADKIREDTFRWMNHHRVQPFPLSRMGREAIHLGQESPRVRERYGRHTFGQSCLVARKLVETGVRFVTVNMFDTVFQKPSWDMHAYGGSLPVNFETYQNVICPLFDQAFSSLLADLDERGLWDDVLVVATGEFGRTPKLNARGGRDHWPGCWTGIVAGGGTKGGQVIGQSDETASEPKDRPVSAGEWVATILHQLGVSPSDSVSNGKKPMPIQELC
ncbi:MAG: DUF1501 domain-containing protein [Planctomycetota bacterium]